MGAQAFADIDPTLWEKRKELSRQKKQLDKIASGKKMGQEYIHRPDFRAEGDIWKHGGITSEALLKEIRALKKKNREYELKNAKLRSESDIKKEEMSHLRRKIGEVSRQNRSQALQQSKLVQENRQLRVEVAALRRKLGKHMAERVSMQAQYSALVSELGNNDVDEDDDIEDYYNDNEDDTTTNIGRGAEKEYDTGITAKIKHNRMASDEISASELDTTQLLNLDPFDTPKKKDVCGQKRTDNEVDDMDTEKLLSI